MIICRITIIEVSGSTPQERRLGVNAQLAEEAICDVCSMCGVIVYSSIIDRGI